MGWSLQKPHEFGSRRRAHALVKEVHDHHLSLEEFLKGGNFTGRPPTGFMGKSEDRILDMGAAELARGLESDGG